MNHRRVVYERQILPNLDLKQLSIVTSGQTSSRMTVSGKQSVIIKDTLTDTAANTPRHSLPTFHCHVEMQKMKSELCVQRVQR